MTLRFLLLIVSFSWFSAAVTAAEQEPEKPPAATTTERSVEQIAKQARKSIVVITVTGRDGNQQGLGTGFIVDVGGLIATNLHVIGEARPIAVQTVEGQTLDVLSVHASDRHADLAILRVDSKDLPALELADSNELNEGQNVVALGNPHGLKHSVVSGVVSGKREIEGRPMIQLAIPIEPGNSGGPLLDLQGRVHGVLTMKSAVTANLGFAMPSAALKPLLEKPNPIPMSRWLTIGTLDAKEWTLPMGGRWRQRAGRISASGTAPGFGGRSLCIAHDDPPQPPYEVAVQVRLDDESGAAGLIFASDGADKHYGFYPSGGKLRLTRFDGPDVYSWTILSNEASSHYRPGEWNTLKVRIEADKLCCYVNDHLAVESADTGLKGGKVGLAKFRQTQAEFKQFQVAKQIASAGVTPELLGQVNLLIEQIEPGKAPAAAVLEKLSTAGEAGRAALANRARQLAEQAAQLKRIASAVHQRAVEQLLIAALEGPEEQIDLFHAGLLIALLDNDEVDVQSYRKQIDRMAVEISQTLPNEADDQARIAALNKYLFQEQGFHGSRHDYYNRANSYLNEVLDDREGLPITISVLYMELGRRIGLTLVGIGLPGHFVVQHVPAKGKPQLIDPYEGGLALTREAAAKLVEQSADRPLSDRDLEPLAKRAIIARMLYNLRGIAIAQKDTAAVLRYVDALLTVSPDLVPERSMRAVLRHQTGDRAGAQADIDWLLKHQPEGIDLDRVRQFKELLDRGE